MSTWRPHRRLAFVRVVGLLRGVNLGSNRRLPMAELKAVVESLGCTDVATYLQSGNVVFSPPRGSDGTLGSEISRALATAVGLSAAVQIRTGAEMAAVVAANPYERADPTKVVVTFCPTAPQPPDLDLAAFAPEGLTVHGREVYLDLPGGQARSPLLAALARTSPDDGQSTSRNWRTVLALAERTS
jgi:uncharacterized protein (DUF1697 family)